jgi:hypothetical protein
LSLFWILILHALAMDTRIKIWYDVDKIISKSLDPIILKYKGKEIRVLFQHDCDGLAQEFVEVAYSQFHCNSCKERSYRLCQLSNGVKPVLMPMDIISKFPQNEDIALYKKMAVIASKIVQTRIKRVLVLSGDTIYNYGMNKDTSKYKHWTFKTFADTSVKDYALIQAAFDRYINKFPKIASCGTIEKLEKLKQYATEAKYGIILSNPISWLISLINSLHALPTSSSSTENSDWQRLVVYMQHLLTAPLLPDPMGAVCPFFQTAKNNIIELLGLEREAAIKLMETRFSPTEYQRRTANPNDNEISMGFELLGSFKNEIMTFDEARQCSGFVEIRANGSLTTIPDDTKMTITQLTSLVGSAGNFVVELMCTDNEPCYIAKTTLGKNVKYPYLWSFIHENDKNGWKKMRAIVKINNTRNVLFITDTKYTSFGDCCFPEFLSSNLTRVCGKYFEYIGKQQ